jgi:hypothetical protein
VLLDGDRRTDRRYLEIRASSYAARVTELVKRSDHLYRIGGGPVHHAPVHRTRTPGRPVRAMLATPHGVTNFTPRLSPRAEQYEGLRLVFRIPPDPQVVLPSRSRVALISRSVSVSKLTRASEKTGATLLPRTGADGSYSGFRYLRNGGPLGKRKTHALPRLVWPRRCGTVGVRNVGSNGREICAETAVLAELNRFFANELGMIDAIVRRPWLKLVAMPFRIISSGCAIAISSGDTGGVSRVRPCRVQIKIKGPRGPVSCLIHRYSPRRPLSAGLPGR